MKEGFFSVNNREKPSEYIYEETEILNYTALEKRLQKIEEDLKNFKSEETDPTIPDWAKQPEKPKYTAGEVGAAAVDEVIGLINFHNTAGNSHNDLRVRMDNFTSSLNNKANKNEIPQIYDWAKQPNKPTYTAEETGAISSAAFNELSSSVSALTNSQVGKKNENGGEIFNDYTNNIASGIHSHAEGQNNKARGRFSHAEGLNTEVKADAAHTEGEATISYTVGSHAEGKSTQAGGNGTDTGGSYAHAEGVNTIALARGSHAEGENTLAQAQYSHAEGGSCQATGDYSHAEGCNNGNIMTTASGKGSHAEGIGNWAIGKGSHAEGINNSASRDYSHAEGDSTTASGTASHTEGKGTIANSSYQHVQGKFNIEDTANKYAHIVGNGSSVNARSNAHTVDWDGNAEFKGDVVANGCGGENPISLIELSEKVKNSDWEQNDETAPDYIKNRTHYATGLELDIEQEIPCNRYTDIDERWYNLLIKYIGTGTTINGEPIQWMVSTGSEVRFTIGNSTAKTLTVSKSSQKVIIKYSGTTTGTVTAICKYSKIDELKQLDEKFIPDNIPKIQYAEIGQMLAVKEVDEDGKPTKWNAVDIPGLYVLNLAEIAASNYSYLNDSTFEELLRACRQGDRIFIDIDSVRKYGFNCIKADDSMIVLNSIYSNDDLGGTIYGETFICTSNNVEYTIINVYNN